MAMTVNQENLGGGRVRITVEVDAQQFDKTRRTYYIEHSSKYRVSGYADGRAPMSAIVEKYGPDVMLEETAQRVITDTISLAVKRAGFEAAGETQNITPSEAEGGHPFSYTFEICVKKKLTAEDYKGVEVTAIPTEISDEEVDEGLAAMQQQYAALRDAKDAPSQEGDTVDIDFEGVLDGIAFEGGTAKGYKLQLGSGTFIPGFEEQLIGKSAGETCDVNVSFPENYQAAELAGKAVVFHCKINRVLRTELPALDDTFASNYSSFSTLHALRSAVKNALAKQKESDARDTMLTEAVLKIAEKAGTEAPAADVEKSIDDEMQKFTQMLASQGATLEQYTSMTGISEPMLREQYRTSVEGNIKANLVLEAVAEAEGITVSEEEFNEVIRIMAQQYNAPEDQLRSRLTEEVTASIKASLLRQRAAQVISDNVKPVENT